MPIKARVLRSATQGQGQAQWADPNAGLMAGLGDREEDGEVRVSYAFVATGQVAVDAVSWTRKDSILQNGWDFDNVREDAANLLKVNASNEDYYSTMQHCLYIKWEGSKERFKIENSSQPDDLLPAYWRAVVAHGQNFKCEVDIDTEIPVPPQRKRLRSIAQMSPEEAARKRRELSEELESRIGASGGESKESNEAVDGEIDHAVIDKSDIGGNGDNGDNVKGKGVVVSPAMVTEVNGHDNAALRGSSPLFTTDDSEPATRVSPPPLELDNLPWSLDPFAGVHQVLTFQRRLDAHNGSSRSDEEPKVSGVRLAADQASTQSSPQMQTSQVHNVQRALDLGRLRDPSVLQQMAEMARDRPQPSSELVGLPEILAPYNSGDIVIVGQVKRTSDDGKLTAAVCTMIDNRIDGRMSRREDWKPTYRLILFDLRGTALPPTDYLSLWLAPVPSSQVDFRPVVQRTQVSDNDMYKFLNTVHRQRQRAADAAQHEVRTTLVFEGHFPDDSQRYFADRPILRSPEKETLEELGRKISCLCRRRVDPLAGGVRDPSDPHIEIHLRPGDQNTRVVSLLVTEVPLEEQDDEYRPYIRWELGMVAERWGMRDFVALVRFGLF